MSIIEELRKKLEKHPEIKFKEGENSICIFPMNNEGFAISVVENPSSYSVAFDGWHESFENKEEALNCVGFGLSDSCRLKTIYRGKTPQKWIVEFKENGKWVVDSKTGIFLFPFWLKPRVVYKQNHIIKET